MLLIVFLSCEYNDVKKDDKCNDDCRDLYQYIYFSCASGSGSCSMDDLILWNIICHECSDEVM
jgi:hypothetical protein